MSNSGTLFIYIINTPNQNIISLHKLRKNLHKFMSTYLPTSNGEIHYCDYNDVVDHPMVFIHGFPLDQTSWDNQVSFFKKSNRVITYDLMGLGHSKFSYPTVTIDSHVDDLIHLMNHLHLDKLHLVGLSMGGYIALRAVLKHSDRFHSVVLANTKAEGDDNKAKANRFEQIDQLKLNGTSSFTKSILTKLLSPNYREKYFNETEQLSRIIALQSITGLNANLIAMASRFDHTLDLRTIKTPTLVISALNDEIISQENSATLKNNIVNAESVTLEDSGHLSNLEQPVGFNAAIKSFLNRRN